MADYLPNGGSTSAMPRCQYCNGVHAGTCPRIKRIDYYPNGTVKSVELHPLTGAAQQERDR